MESPFYYHPRMLAYDFGAGHPLKPERLARTIELLAALGCSDPLDPGPGEVADVLRVHDPQYVEVVRRIGDGCSVPAEERTRFGFGSLDNPSFTGMFDASLAYVAGTVAAARAVASGHRRAFSLAGGLHHAMKAKASGFCVFNDPAIAVSVMLERFARVAYVDLDVHHGDGVQWLWFFEPRVLTCSIHEDGSTLFPGSGSVDETGERYSAVNVPLQAKTSGDVWLWAFENGVLPALSQFRPEALVLQLGTDVHYEDRLGHLHVTAQDWLAAVRHIHALNIPTVALGGGGYSLTTVPRMWAMATLALQEREIPPAPPIELAARWGMPSWFDASDAVPHGVGRENAESVIRWLHEQVIPYVGGPDPS